MLSCFLLFGSLSLASSLQAQDNPPAPASPAKSEAQAEIEILADDGLEYDSQSRLAIYRGNVRVSDPQMKLKCQVLTAQLSVSNKIETIVAEHAVEIELTDERETSRAVSDKAVYTAATELVVLTGSPKVTNKQGTLTGDRVMLDRTKGKLRAEGHVRMLMPADALKQSGFGAPKKPAGAGSKP